MLITLQEGCDYIIRRKANAALGLIPEWRDHLLATLDDNRETNVGGIMVDLSMDVLDSHRKALRSLRKSYWLAVESDLDNLEEKRILTLIDGIQDDARSTRVTRTSLATLVRVKLKENISAWLSEDPLERLHFDVDTPFKKRERTLLCVIALAAREIASTNPKVLKDNQSINKDAVASLLLERLTDLERRNGLTADNISRIITTGLEELA